MPAMSRYNCSEFDEPHAYARHGRRVMHHRKSKESGVRIQNPKSE